MFAEMLVQAQGHGNAEEIAKTMSLVDIIYEMKKLEEESKKEEPESKKEEPESKKEEPSSPVVIKIKDFWSRLTHDSDTD
jgi:hypothetical protein